VNLAHIKATGLSDNTECNGIKWTSQMLDASRHPSPDDTPYKRSWVQRYVAILERYVVLPC
jgi:hypothetical protein